jgi:hypothetical protein
VSRLEEIVERALVILTSALVLSAVVAVGGCSNGAPDASLMRYAVADGARSGVAPQFLSFLRFGETLRGMHRSVQVDARDLFVSDFGTGEVEILKNEGWYLVAIISAGMAGPDGSFVDANGNFYVAEYRGPSISEYAPGSLSPSFSYSAAMNDPVNVNVDTNGNVYEADFNGGYVNEYAQSSNSVINSCSPGGSVEGIAIDRSGDVFVAYNTSSEARIVEYAGGLSGCSGKVLGVKLQYAGGVVLDRQMNLIACDQGRATVDVIKPPYDRVSRKLGSGYQDPFHVTINAHNTRVLVADQALADVQVLSYPSGTNIATLGSSNDLVDPSSAVDGSNAVY